jgi:hypothetical protein
LAFLAAETRCTMAACFTAIGRQPSSLSARPPAPTPHASRLLAAGKSQHAARAGRWKTAEMVAKYTRKQGARQSAAVRIAHQRVQF